MRPKLIKCVVWDLDDTIWHGRLLDGGDPVLVPGIQEVLSELDRRGILNSIASSNEHSDAWAHLASMGLAHLFVAPEINMGEKWRSISRISERISMGLEHIAFVDDDPLERAWVEWKLPEVLVLPAASYAQVLSMPEMTPSVVSPLSSSRRVLVQTELSRQDTMSSYATIDDFLRSCSINLSGRFASDGDLSRLDELTTRTNQMNVAGKQYTAEELAAWMIGPNRHALVADVRDRFGDFGTVALALLRRENDSMVVDAMWVSCRVAKRGVPAAFFSLMGGVSHSEGASSLLITHRPNGRNRLAAFHMGQYGFHVESCKADQVVRYRLELPSQVRPYPEWMTVGWSGT